MSASRLQQGYDYLRSIEWEESPAAWFVVDSSWHRMHYAFAPEMWMLEAIANHGNQGVEGRLHLADGTEYVREHGEMFMNTLRRAYRDHGEGLIGIVDIHKQIVLTTSVERYYDQLVRCYRLRCVDERLQMRSGRRIAIIGRGYGGAV